MSSSATIKRTSENLGESTSISNCKQKSSSIKRKRTSRFICASESEDENSHRKSKILFILVTKVNHSTTIKSSSKKPRSNKESVH